MVYKGGSMDAVPSAWKSDSTEDARRSRSIIRADSLTTTSRLSLCWKTFPRLLILARRHLDREIRVRYDEEDLLQSVGKSIFRRLERGDFDLAGRDDLWPLLVTITLNKACNAAAGILPGGSDRTDNRRDAAPRGVSTPSRSPPWTTARLQHPANSGYPRGICR
jgi:hypothetical protein